MSVCILHRDGWAACDSRTLAGHDIFPDNAVKAFSASGWLVTCAGSALLQQRMLEIVKNNNESEVLDQIAEELGDQDGEGDVLLVNGSKNLVHIDQGGCHTSIDPTEDFWAIGCAYKLVIGYLKCISETQNRPVTPDDAAAAIKMAAKYDAGIDDRVKIFLLNG